ncbi:MAG: radical SAM protein [Planctomycetota bacterium]
MIGISKLYCDTTERSDALRYGHGRERSAQPAPDRRPVVVWNATRRCNLKCMHCYSHSDDAPAGDEMTADEGRALIDDLAGFGSPVILFSGGEPLTRPDLYDLAAHAAERGIRAAISTNGTLIDDAAAARLKEAGIAYAGVSLDGLRETNDAFRCVDGAFDRALAGIRACKRAGVKVGVRFTISRHTAADIPGIFDLIEADEIPRACFYHLVYTGRGSDLAADDLTHDETRRAVDLIIDRTADLHRRGLAKEILTVDNHSDGPYLYLRMQRDEDPRADRVLELLRRNGGNSSGVGIGCVSWDGSVYADQFWRRHSFGNVRERPFSEIWQDLSDPLMAKLKEKHKHVKGRCAACRFLDACAGNLRARAEAVTGDVWAAEPACYLTDKEIDITPEGCGS